MLPLSRLAMSQEFTTGPSQFRLVTLISLTTCIAFFCALATWVVQSDSFGTLDNIPIVIVPSIPLVGVGAFIVPIACLAIALLMLVLILRSSPRLFSAILFFGFVAMAILMNSEFWDNSLRLLFALSLSSIAMLLETRWRKLPKSQTVAASLSVFVCFGYYAYLLSVFLITVF